MVRAQTFGMMVVSQEDTRVECEFRHLSLAEYLTALHVHITGEPLKVIISKGLNALIDGMEVNNSLLNLYQFCKLLTIY